MKALNYIHIVKSVFGITYKFKIQVNAWQTFWLKIKKYEDVIDSLKNPCKEWDYMRFFNL